MSHGIAVWGCWLENVQMAGPNGGVLIACLQISHRLPPVAQSMSPRYRVGNQSEAGHLLLCFRGAGELITCGPPEKCPGAQSQHPCCFCGRWTWCLVVLVLPSNLLGIQKNLHMRWSVFKKKKKKQCKHALIYSIISSKTGSSTTHE